MPKKNDIFDFWSKVSGKHGDEKSCWLWVGSTFKSKNEIRGTFSYKGKSFYSHRLMFFLNNKYLPEAVCHKCDVPLCCNPSHLFGGTRALNNKDRSMKGRGANNKGEKHNLAKLTEKEVLEIRFLKKKGAKGTDLAKTYKVSGSVISSICARRSWRHVQ